MNLVAVESAWLSCSASLRATADASGRKRKWVKARRFTSRCPGCGKSSQERIFRKRGNVLELEGVRASPSPGGQSRGEGFLKLIFGVKNGHARATTCP